MKKILIFYLLLISISLAHSSEISNNFATVLFESSEKDQLKLQGNFHPKYVFLSLILPGAGEYFLGHKKIAKIFFGTELLILGSYLGAQAYIDVLENDYKTFAALHANVNTYNKSEQYWIDLGNADHIFSFNEKKRIERNINALYPETPDNFWEWDSRENRLAYNKQRFKQHDWKHRLNIIIGAFIFNRIVSAVDVIRLIRKNKKSEQKQFSRLYFDYHTNRNRVDSVRLNFRVNW